MEIDASIPMLTGGVIFVVSMVVGLILGFSRDVIVVGTDRVRF